MNESSTATTPTRPIPREEMDALLAQLKSSGKSVPAFAREHGLPPWKIYNARKARAKRAARKKTALVPVRLKANPALKAEPIELLLSGGHRLIIPANFDEQTLRRLMGALAGC